MEESVVSRVGENAPNWGECASFLEAALAYAALGLRVVPIYEPAGPGECSCSAGRSCEDAGKHPRLGGYELCATTDPVRLEEWGVRWPSANVGILLPRGVMVIDVDGDAGRETVSGLEARLGPLPPGPCVLTARGWHLWFRVPLELESRGRLGEGVDLLGAGRLEVVPPSTHRTGVVYGWRAGVPHTLAQLPELPPSWLAECARGSAPASRRLVGERARGMMPEWADVALRTGTDPRGPTADTSRSSLVWKWLLRAANAGIPESEVVAALTDGRNALSEKPLEKNDPAAWVRREYERARAKVEASPPVATSEEALALIRELLLRALVTRWEGRSGPSRLAVLLAVCELASASGRLELGASVRQVAERAGVSKTAAAARLRELMRGGWLRGKPWRDVRVARRYALRVPPMARWDLPASAPAVSPPGHDAWRGAHGRWLLFELLASGPATAYELADRRGVTPGTVRRDLRELEGLNLVRRSGRAGRSVVWARAVVTVDLERVARLRKRLGAAEAQRLRHREERERFNELLARGGAPLSSRRRDGPRWRAPHRTQRPPASAGRRTPRATGAP